MELLPVSVDALIGTVPLFHLAAVETMVGEHEAAVDLLERLLSIPSWWSVWDLRLDPRWDPLRDHPRFKKLVAEETGSDASR